MSQKSSRSSEVISVFIIESLGVQNVTLYMKYIYKYVYETHTCLGIFLTTPVSTDYGNQGCINLPLMEGK